MLEAFWLTIIVAHELKIDTSLKGLVRLDRPIKRSEFFMFLAFWAFMVEKGIVLPRNASQYTMTSRARKSRGFPIALGSNLDRLSGLVDMMPYKPKRSPGFT